MMRKSHKRTLRDVLTARNDSRITVNIYFDGYHFMHLFCTSISLQKWQALLLFAGAGVACAAPEPAQKRETLTQIVVLDAPSNLGLRPPAPGKEPGVKKLAAALRKTGLVERLGASDAGLVEPPAYSPEPDPVVGFRNSGSLNRYSQALADRVAPLITKGNFVLVLGGDCSVLVGTGLATRSLGHYGLAFIDAHDDFSYPRQRSKYFGIFVGAGLDLGLATGHGPPQLANIRDQSPYFQEKDVIQMVCRAQRKTPSTLKRRRSTGPISNA
jgi:arginase family enzyme